MKSRTSLILAGFLFVNGAVQAAEKAGSEDSAKRPNILFLFADDWGWPHASCLGDTVVQTPTIDRIVKEGVLFRNAHSAAPSCSPSRAAILTGQWHWRLEDGANLRGFIPAKFEVYPDLLKDAGYHVGMAGKGYAPGTDEGRTQNAAGKKYKGLKAFLEERPKGQPFCFWFGSSQPHRPYKEGAGVNAGIDPAKVQVPPYLPDNAIVRSDICDYYYETQRFDQQCSEALEILEKTGELENTLVVVTGDNGWPFPRSKGGCYDSGTHQVLAMRWGAKAKPNRVVDDFVSLSDLAPTFLEVAGLKVPPNMTARSLVPILLSEKSGRIDPARGHTLTGMERHVLDGRSDGDQTNVGYPMRTLITEEFHYIRNFRPNRWPAGDLRQGPLPPEDVVKSNTHVIFGDCDSGPTKAFFVVHVDESDVRPFWERAFAKRPARELYDKRKDPFELRNVAEEPAYAEIVKEMDERLMSELKVTGDPRAVGEGDQFDRYKGKK